MSDTTSPVPSPSVPPPSTLAPYLARIDYSGSRDPTLDTLSGLVRAHVLHVPFENLDVQMGRPILLDLASLETKFVVQRRGGYCFEHNTWFAHVLETLGFEVMRCEGRVRFNSNGVVRPRTHMTLVVRLDRRDLLVDVGFGGYGPIVPVPLDGNTVREGRFAWRVATERDDLVLQCEVDATWADLYAFRHDERFPVDFEMANWFTSTYPRSQFVTNLIAQRVLPDGHRILRNLTLTETTASGMTSFDIARDDVERVLRDGFGLQMEAGASFLALDGPPATE